MYSKNKAQGYAPTFKSGIDPRADACRCLFFPSLPLMPSETIVGCIAIFASCVFCALSIALLVITDFCQQLSIALLVITDFGQP